MVSHSPFPKPILIIDDIKEERAALVEQLGKYRDEFPALTEAVNLADALVHIREDEPICCLIGPGVTRKAGLELLQLIRHDYPADLLAVVVIADDAKAGLMACRHFRAEDIRVNVTLCFSAAQALLAAKAGASYISPFVGRLDDIAQDGMQLIEQIVQIYSNYDFQTEVLVASVRHPVHVVQAALLGADVATVPAKVLHQLMSHPLTDKGLEGFLADWAKLPEAKRKI